MSWEYFTTTRYEEAIERAKEMGWKEKEVQVRVEFRDYIAHYLIEPFERDCGCPELLNYKKAFGEE